MACPLSIPALNTDDHGSDDRKLARDTIDAHATKAANVARENAVLRRWAVKPRGRSPG
jgi:hypothetical protein